jgi:hypothetical protein
MMSTSPRHAKHARVASGHPTGAPEAARGMAGPGRRRRSRLLLIVAPVLAMLVAVGLAGMHIVSWPVHMTADASRQQAGTSVVKALPVALSCCNFPPAIPAAARPSASHRHHAARPSASPRYHAAVSASASSGGDGTSPPGSVAGWRLTYRTDFPGTSLPSGWYAYNGEPGGDPNGNWEPSTTSPSCGRPSRASGHPKSISSRIWEGPGRLFPPAFTWARTGTAIAASSAVPLRAATVRRGIPMACSGHRARSPTRSTGGSGPASPAVRSVPPRNGPPFP